MKDEDLKVTVMDRTVDSTDMNWQRGKSRDRDREKDEVRLNFMESICSRAKEEELRAEHIGKM